MELEKPDLNLKEYSRREIRKALLDINPSAEIYSYSYQSLKHRNISRVWYAVGTIFLSTGVYSFTRSTEFDNNGLALESIGSAFTGVGFTAMGVGAMIAGFYNTAKSRKTLNRALELYHNREYVGY